MVDKHGFSDAEWELLLGVPLAVRAEDESIVAELTERARARGDLADHRSGAAANPARPPCPRARPPGRMSAAREGRGHGEAQP